MVSNYLRLKQFAFTFCRLRRSHHDPLLILNGTLIHVVETTKFLGITVTASFRSHTYANLLGSLRVVAYTIPGADHRLHTASTVCPKK